MIENYEIVEFQNGEFKLDVSVTPNSETVWLSVYQMSKLFNKNKSTILRHIKNILEEELDEKKVVQNLQLPFLMEQEKEKHRFTMSNTITLMSLYQSDIESNQKKELFLENGQIIFLNSIC